MRLLAREPVPLMVATSASSDSIRAIPSRSASSWPLVAALTLIAMAFAVLVSYSWRYYLLVWDERFESPLHHRLRSSGSLGHLYGNIGLALILGNLLYLVRRRLVHVPWLGSMKGWMDWHVFSGLVGPAFVLFHSAFTLRTWPAVVSATALAIVVVTGLFGRYLYRLVPRIADGRQEPAEELAADVDRALITLHGLGPGSAQAAELIELRVEAAVTGAGAARSGIGAIGSAVRTMWRMRELRPAARAAALEAGASHRAAAEIGHAAAKIGRLIARVDLVDTFARAAAFWRGLHRNLVLLMLVTASLHVSIAVYLGFGL
jgi:dihydropyrimidine dehydrogenase (NAD+) subunit PreT